MEHAAAGAVLAEMEYHEAGVESHIYRLPLQVYRQAAPILAAMEEETAGEVVSEMEYDATAYILGEMDYDIAANILAKVEARSPNLELLARKSEGPGARHGTTNCFSVRNETFRQFASTDLRAPNRVRRKLEGDKEPCVIRSVHSFGHASLTASCTTSCDGTGSFGLDFARPSAFMLAPGIEPSRSCPLPFLQTQDSPLVQLTMVCILMMEYEQLMPRKSACKGFVGYATSFCLCFAFTLVRIIQAQLDNALREHRPTMVPALSQRWIVAKPRVFSWLSRS